MAGLEGMALAMPCREKAVGVVRQKQTHYAKLAKGYEVLARIAEPLTGEDEEALYGLLNHFRIWDH